MKVVLMRMFVLACVLLCGAGVRAQTPAPAAFAFDGPSGAFPADLNGDGRVDVVLRSGTVFLGNADGSFSPMPAISLGPNVSLTVAAVADFNGDGKADVLAEANQTFLYVFPGNGDGTFGAPSTTNVGIELQEVQAIDLNGDGKADVIGVSTSTNNGQVLVCLGNGDGTFRGVTSYTAFSATGIKELVAADFNGDGKIDIAAAGDTANANGPIGVLPGRGDGTFGTSINSAGVNSPSGLAAADFNGDGKLDLVVAGTDLSDFTEQTYLLAGNGDGTFQAPTVVAPGSGTLSVADINGDGKPDVVVWADPFIEVFLGNGNGTFNQKATYLNSSVNASFFVAVGDFNGDGKLDVSNGYVVMFGNGDGTFNNLPANLINVRMAKQLTTVTSGDFNGDGKPDLAVGTSNQSIYILLGDGTGKYSVANEYSVPAAPLTIQTSDLNGDGKTDLIFNTGNFVTGNIETMLGNGDGSFGAAVSSALGLSSQFEIEDFNGDGMPDVGALVGGQMAVLIGVGDGTFEAPVSYFAGADANSFGLGDFNGDGKADAVVCGSAGIGVLLGRGDGTLGSASFPDPPPPPPPPGPAGPPPTSTCSLFAAADFNNDGVTDLFVYQFQAISMLLGNGDGTFTTITSSTPVTGFSGVGAVADMNGDGNLDIVEADGLSVLFGKGDGTFGGGTSFAVPWIDPAVWNTGELNGAIFAVDKFSGTGLPGIAMFVPNTPGGEISLPNPLTAPAPDFALSATIPALLIPGGQTSLTAASKAIGAFSSDVALSCGGLPDGVTCSFASATIAGGSGKTTLTINAASSTALGRYSFTLTGTSSTKSHDRAVAITIATSAGATNASLLPAALNYSSSPVGSRGNALTTTLTNAGGVPLQISSVSIAGTNAADFSVSSNGCGTSVPAYASCVIGVGFAPTASGTRSAMLVVKDNATGGAQVASLSAAGQDFTVAAGSSGNSATVAAGKTATYSISVGGSSGFSGSVALSCSGAPTGAACTVSPTSVMVSGAAATATVSVTTTARSAMTPLANRDDRWTPSIYGSPRVVATYAMVLAVSFLLWTFGGTLRRRRMSRAAVAGGVLLLVGIAMSGCGGGGTSSSTSGGTTPPPSGGTATGTPAGNYAITVMATAGSGANAVSHTTTLTLVVE